MFQEFERAAIAKQKKIIGHASLDKELNILSCSPELRQWCCTEPGMLTGSSLLDLCPQLKSSQALIIESIQIPGSLFIYHQAYFASSHHPDHLFDLQIESFPDLPDRLLLTVIPLATDSLTNSEQNLAELTHQNQALLLLNRASQVLTATLDLPTVLERLLQLTAQIINAAGSSVWLWEDKFQKKLVCRSAFHPGTDEKLIGMRVASGQGIVGWVAAENKGTIVADPAKDGRFYPHIDARSGFVTSSILAVPIQLRSRILGVLAVVNKQDGRFLAKDLTYAEMLAASAAIAIDNAQLVETLQQKMTDLKTQNEELKAFDHTVAHDLQNPLALVVGFAELLQTDNIGISQVEREHALRLLVQNAHRMSNIIQELLILSSVRESEVETHPLDMAEIVLGAMDRLRFMMQQHKVRIVLPDSWAVAAGYAPWIEEVWENYLSNALKYGGDPPYIELGNTVLADGRIQFWIRDNGRGVPPEKQSLLFTPFTKLSEVRITGHGLGLSIVRRIMEKLGGEVGVESQPDQGSTFSFTLPAFQITEE